MRCAYNAQSTRYYHFTCCGARVERVYSRRISPPKFDTGYGTDQKLEISPTYDANHSVGVYFSEAIYSFFSFFFFLGYMARFRLCSPTNWSKSSVLTHLNILNGGGLESTNHNGIIIIAVWNNENMHEVFLDPCHKAYEIHVCFSRFRSSKIIEVSLCIIRSTMLTQLDIIVFIVYQP